METRSEHSAAAAKAAGAVGLVLAFLGTASFTWALLSDAPAQTEASVASPEIVVAPQPDSFKNVRLAAKSAIVVDETAGRTLFAFNPDLQWPLASLTKVALALVVSQVLPADTVITIPYDTGPGALQLHAGERWTLQDVIDFTLPMSSNLGADILAQAADASVHARYPLSPASSPTLWRMNDLARQLGMAQTYFLNDNGLDESRTLSGAYGSARDVATLFAYAATSAPRVFAATTRDSFTLTSQDGVRTSAINTDLALPAIPNMALGKTGYTDLAGGNLAVCFHSGGHLLCAAALGSTETGRFDDMKLLVAAAEAAVRQKE